MILQLFSVFIVFPSYGMLSFIRLMKNCTFMFLLLIFYELILYFCYWRKNKQEK